MEYTGTGRSWTNVSLKLSDCNIFTMTTNLNANATSAPTLEYSGSVTWPTVQGTPNGTGWEIKFPCSVFVTNGTTDMLADYQFTGRTLANNFAWTSTRAASYYMDSFFVGSYSYSQQKIHWNGKSGCMDSRTSNPRTNANTHLYAYHYGPTYPTASFKNKFRVYMYSYHTAENAPVLHLLDFFGGSPGRRLPGVTCANTYVGASPAMVIFPMMAQAGSAYAGPNYFGTPIGLIPVVPAAIGHCLFCQAAWANSGNGGLKFSIGTEVVIPQLPPYLDYTKTRRLCYIEPYAGRIYRYQYYYANPICKYN